MLNKLYIKDFKSIDNLTLNLRYLTILAGTNSAGKSSIIQSILLLSHNITNDFNSPLNGHLVSIGNFDEASNFITNAKKFNIDLDGFELEFIGDDSKKNCEVKIIKDNEAIKDVLNYHRKKLHYICADRLGSQDLYLKNFDMYDKFGVFGEFAIDYFEKEKRNPIENNLIIDKNSTTLETQVNYWLKYIINAKLQTNEIMESDRVKATFNYMNNRPVRTKNIGSGLSYIISILIVCLASKKDDVIIIENPEIHLHPKAQSKLTEFFTFIANAGIQLIIETHSDHIFNGIRVAVNKKRISTDKISINFFDLDMETLLTKHSEIKLNEYGGVINHINGLFDQFDDDLDELLGL